MFASHPETHPALRAPLPGGGLISCRKRIFEQTNLTSKIKRLNNAKIRLMNFLLSQEISPPPKRGLVHGAIGKI
jgi:hypothetical protein